MSVLHVVASAGRYGAEVVIAALAREQHELGMSVHVVIVSDNLAATAPYAEELRRDCHARVVVIQGRGLRDLFLAQRIAQIATVADASIIHSHGYKSDILCSRVQLPHVRRISTLHGWTNVRPWSRLALYQKMQVRALSRFDAVVAVHDSVWRQHSHLARLPHRHSVPNGLPSVEVAQTTEVSADEPYFNTGKPIVLVAGRLSPEKGQIIALEAIGLLKARGLDPLLVCAGEGPDKDFLHQRAELLGISDSVFFPGYVRWISGLLKRATVVLIPSYKEGLPIVLLEAMREGAPVVASAVGGMVSVLDHGRVGRLVTPGSAHEIADALETLLADSEARSSLLKAAQEHFIRRYSAKVMARKYLDIYQPERSEVFLGAGCSYSSRATTT